MTGQKEEKKETEKEEKKGGGGEEGKLSQMGRDGLYKRSLRTQKSYKKVFKRQNDL